MIDFVLFVLTLCVCGKLWRMGGDGEKWARAVGVPATISIVKVIFCRELGASAWLCLLYGPALWVMMSLFSYGITAPPHKFVAWILGNCAFYHSGEHRPTEIVTRALCGFFWALAAGVFAYVTGAYSMWFLYVLFLTVVNGYVGGTVRDVEISERLVGAAVAFALIV